MGKIYLAIRSFSLTIRMICLIATINLLSIPVAQSQGSGVKIYPSIGISAGFFNPEHVNQFIKQDLSSYMTFAGSSDIFAYYELHGGLTFKIKFIDISGFAEFATAPKIIVVTNGNSRSYFFNRLTFGAGPNFYIPLGKRNNAFFVGGDLLYNILMFKDFRASAPGFRLQGGVSLQFGGFNVQPFLAFNYAKAADKSVVGDFDLNYTGGQIGVYLSIHK